MGEELGNCYWRRKGKSQLGFQREAKKKMACKLELPELVNVFLINSFGQERIPSSPPVRRNPHAKFIVLFSISGGGYLWEKSWKVMLSWEGFLKDIIEGDPFGFFPTYCCCWGVDPPVGSALSKKMQMQFLMAKLLFRSVKGCMWMWVLFEGLCPGF